MPYRFFLPYHTTGFPSDPVAGAFSTMMNDHLRALSVALGCVLPILTDEEWNALPQETRALFVSCSEAPREGVTHRPAARGHSSEDILASRNATDTALRRMTAADNLRDRAELQARSVRGNRDVNAVVAAPPLGRQTFTDIELEDI